MAHRPISCSPQLGQRKTVLFPSASRLPQDVQIFSFIIMISASVLLDKGHPIFNHDSMAERVISDNASKIAKDARVTLFFNLRNKICQYPFISFGTTACEEKGSKTEKGNKQSVWIQSLEIRDKRR